MREKKRFRNLYIVEILKKNNIVISKMAEDLSFNRTDFFNRLHGKLDFKIEQLQIIKEYLVDKNIIDKNFDIGCFLDEI